MARLAASARSVLSTSSRLTAGKLALLDQQFRAGAFQRVVFPRQFHFPLIAAADFAHQQEVQGGQQGAGGDADADLQRREGARLGQFVVDAQARGDDQRVARQTAQRPDPGDAIDRVGMDDAVRLILIQHHRPRTTHR